MNTTSNTAKAPRRSMALTAAVAATVAMSLLAPAPTASAAGHVTAEPTTPNIAERDTRSVHIAQRIWHRIDHERPTGAAVMSRARIERLPAHLRAAIPPSSLRGRGSELVAPYLTIRTGAYANAVCLSTISGTVFEGSCFRQPPKPLTLDSTPGMLHRTLVHFDLHRSAYKRSHPRGLVHVKRLLHTELPDGVTGSVSDRNDDGFVDGGRVVLRDAEADRCIEVTLPRRSPDRQSWGTGYREVPCP